MSLLINKLKHILRNIKLWKESMKIKRDNSIILFGSWFGERFADTSRYLYQYLSENKEKYNISRVVWVTRSKEVLDEIRELGYEAYLMNSEESIYYHRKAGIHIICNKAHDLGGCLSDIMGSYSFGAKRINLWHGVMPMKGVGYASNEHKRNKEIHPIVYFFKDFFTAHSKLYRCLFGAEGGWEDSYYLSVTPAGTSILRKFFLLPNSRYIETGNPRVCGKVALTKREQQFIEEIKKSKMVILYLPTFRDSNSTFDYSRVAEPLNAFLKENDAIWVQKSHSAASAATYSYKRVGNIIYLSSDYDISSIMCDINILITDFSSVAADAMYYYKPIIYYMPDYEEYLSKDRGFVIDPTTVMMGDKVTTIDELKEKLIWFFKYNFSADERYIETRLKYWGTEKTMDQIWNDIKKAVKA